ncbi:MAG: sigma-70 family RNA polymerase sigma factor [Terrisporobacter sp.]
MLTEIKVRKAIKGDKQAFLDLIQPQKEKLYKIAYTYVKNEQDTLDIIQETICKAYVSLETLKKPKYFDTWLVKILMNISITTVNKNKKVVYLEDKEVGQDTNSISNCDDRLDLISELDKLPQKYRDVIVLKYFEDLTIEEIANTLEIPIGTARTNLYRGLENIRKSMKVKVI